VAIIDSNVATGAATWRTRRNNVASADSGPLAPLCEKMASSTIPEVHYALQCRQRRSSHGLIMYRKFREVWKCGFWDVRAYRETYRETNRHKIHWSQYFAHRLGSEVIKDRGYFHNSCTQLKLLNGGVKRRRTIRYDTIQYIYVCSKADEIASLI